MTGEAPRGPGRAAAPPRRPPAPRSLAASLGPLPKPSEARKPLPATPGKPGRPASRRPGTVAPARGAVSSPPKPPRSPLAGRLPALALGRGNPPRGGATRAR